MTPYYFYNITKSSMTFDDVYDAISNFIQKDPTGSYCLAIGTDSHVHPRETLFTTAIHIHRKGKGAWGCLRQYRVPRRITSLHEKISIETTLSQQIAAMFTEKHIEQLEEIILPNIDKGADFTYEIHLDIGSKGLTKDLIHEMTGRISAMGMEAKIKPESYAASSYANRYTK